MATETLTFETLPNPALKEWAIICDALARGEQVVDVRKGGIHEEGRRFAIRAERFWLYPSYEHQRPDLLKPSHLPALERLNASRPPEGSLRVEAWAELVEAACLTEEAQVAALDEQFIWTPDYAMQRLNWKPKFRLWLLVLRVHRLDEPITVPLRAEYGGCSSWVPMQDLPPDPASVPSRPAVDDAAFEACRQAIRAALPRSAVRERGTRSRLAPGPWFRSR
jgi:hypothetical protein